MWARAAPARSGVVAPFVVLALALTLTFQCLRVLFPVAYTYREASGLVPTVAVLLAVFVAPALAVPMTRVFGGRGALCVGAFALAGARLWLQFGGRITVGVAAVASGAGLLAIAVAYIEAGRRRQPEGMVLAVVGGLALDTIVRGAFSTWDPVWQGGAAPRIVAVVLAALLAGAAALAARARFIDERAVHSALGWFALAMGGFLALQVLFLQSPAFVASSGQLSMATAIGVVLLGDALGMTAIAFTAPRRFGSRLVVAAAGAVVATITGLLPVVTGSSLVVCVLVAQTVVTGLVAASAASHLSSRAGQQWRNGLGITAGSLAFGATVFLYQAHYDEPLPFSNRWIAVGAAALVGVAAVAALRRSAASEPAPRAAACRRHGAWLAAAVVVGAIVVAGGVAAGEPGLVSPRPHPDTLRVVTYNIHEAVTRDGRIDPSALASAVEQLRPDVLIIEEAGRGWQLSGSIDLGEWLKRRLGMPYVWGWAADRQFGNVVVSRVPVLDARVVALPQGDGTMKRSAVIAHIGPVNGAVVTVVGTHLQNGSTLARKATRLAEVRVLLDELGTVHRTVLAGDLNSDPGSRELMTLLDAGFTTTQPTQRCILKTSNQNCVDWILVSRDLEETPVRTLAVDTFDHRPLVAGVSPRIER
jgi:endonuclease/exonuclease/phosphatase family metal-dependent hydrolase